MHRITSSSAIALVFLASCGEKPNTPGPAAQKVPAVKEEAPITFSLANMDDWKAIENGVSGAVTAKDGIMKLGLGAGLTGVVYKGKADLPVLNYELAWEARLADGLDFLAAATFPVRNLETCGTFINGGWGGGVTGVSCLDGLAANENNTTTSFTYEANRWYKFRIQVTNEMLVAFIDDKKVVNANILEKKISLRTGDIEQCAPFGFASYETKGEIRNIAIRKIKPGEVPLDPNAY